MELANLRHDIPDYAAFYTVDELLASTQQLAQDFPHAVKLWQVAESQRGDPIHLMRIGDGPRTALWYAGSHANEPLGCMVVEYWARRLCEDEALRQRLGYTWYFIKCIDPDAMRRNEGWFRGPFSLSTFARHFYQQPLALMPEFSFPLDKVQGGSTPAVTRVLMQLIDRVKPDYVNSLHCGIYGGVYVDVSHPAPALYPVLHNLVADLGMDFLPHDLLGTPAAVRLAEGIALGQPEPQPADQRGSMRDYVRQYDSFWINAEIDLMQDRRVCDLETSDQLLGDLRLLRHEFWKAQVDWARPVWEAFRAHATLAQNQRLLQVWQPRITYYQGTAPGTGGTERWATVAEAFALDENQRLRALREMGLLLGLLEDEVALGNTGLESLMGEVSTHFDSLATELESWLDYHFLPVQDLIAYQLAAGVAAADYVRDHRDPH